MDHRASKLLKDSSQFLNQDEVTGEMSEMLMEGNDVITTVSYLHEKLNTYRPTTQRGNLILTIV